jgi:hypothetical protein
MMSVPLQLPSVPHDALVVSAYLLVAVGFFFHVMGAVYVYRCGFRRRVADKEEILLLLDVAKELVDRRERQVQRRVAAKTARGAALALAEASTGSPSSTVKAGEAAQTGGKGSEGKSAAPGPATSPAGKPAGGSGGSSSKARQRKGGNGGK